MKFFRTIILIVLSLLLTFSCSTSGKKIEIKESPSVSDTLEGDKVKVRTTLWNPRAIEVINENYLVILDDSKKGIFKVFSLPGIEYLYSWGNRGQGPNGFNSVPSYHSINTKNNKLIIVRSPTPGLSTLEYYKVTDTTLVLTKTKEISYDGQTNPFNNLQRINDTLYFADYGYNDQSNKEFIAIKPDVSTPLFTFGNYPDTDINGSDRYRKYIKRTTSNGNKFVSFYIYHNRFKLFNSRGDLLKDVKLEGYNAVTNNRNSGKYIYRTIAQESSRHIYVLSFFMEAKKVRNNLENVIPSIEVWSWNGDPTKKVVLDTPTTYFTVSKKFGKLYTFTYGSKDELVLYNLSDLN